MGRREEDKLIIDKLKFNSSAIVIKVMENFWKRVINFSIF